MRLSEMAGQKRRLTTEVQRFIVQRLACYESPSEVLAAVKVTFNIKISPSHVVYYDPMSATANLAQEWRELFSQTRAAFVQAIGNIAIAQRAVRLQRLDHLYHGALKAKRYALAGDLLEQAAKEMGGIYTNRRELTAHSPPYSIPRTPQAKIAELREMLRLGRERLSARKGAEQHHNGRDGPTAGETGERR
jgi:hypothetical protein